MANANNPVALLNEFCQKNKLTYAFEKYNEAGMSHNKQFTMRLVVSKQGYPQFLEFYGNGNSLKEAKNDGARKAFQVELIEALRNLVTSSASRSSNANYAYKDNGCNVDKVNELAAQISQIQFSGNKVDPIYECWLKARQMNIIFNIDFVNIRKGISNTTIQVRVTMGNQKYSGKGTVDLEAMYSACEQINLETFPTNSKIEYDDGSSSEDDSAHKVTQLHELHQQLGKPIEFVSLAPMLGQPQDPLFIYKCQFGDLVSYGLAGKKKSAKNKSASKMLKKMNESIQVENTHIQMGNMDKWLSTENTNEIQKILNSGENAISVLEALDKLRPQYSLKFSETSKQIGVQNHYTVECKLLLMPDLKVNTKDLVDCVKKNDLTYLRTSSREIRKKTAKLEAAEKMVNLLKGIGACTHKEVEMHEKLKEFEENLNVKQDVIDADKLTRGQSLILTKMKNHAIQFLADKSHYDEDYDFLAEVKGLLNFIQDMEFEHRDRLKLEIRSSNEVYSLFSDVKNIKTKVVINLTCGISLSAYAECLDETEAKNRAAYQILKKLTVLKNSFIAN